MLRKFFRRPCARHAWAGSATRNPYTVLYSPRMDCWVRAVYFGPDDWVVLDLNNKVMAP